jgi:hypothetical protein
MACQIFGLNVENGTFEAASNDDEWAFSTQNLSCTYDAFEPKNMFCKLSFEQVCLDTFCRSRHTFSDNSQGSVDSWRKRSLPVEIGRDPFTELSHALACKPNFRAGHRQSGSPSSVPAESPSDDRSRMKIRLRSCDQAKQFFLKRQLGKSLNLLTKHPELPRYLAWVRRILLSADKRAS